MNRFAEYLTCIAQVNDLGKGSIVKWFFHNGMLFLSRDKWWGDFKHRSSVHEGMDITFYKTKTGDLEHFDTSIKVPAIADGVLINICNDFLGQTLVVEHKKECTSNQRVIMVYAHLVPTKSLKKGAFIRKGSIIAQVCDTIKNPQLPPHLHFSCFGVPCNIPPENLNWNLFSKQADINMIHPIFL
ncbi:MAG: M23 family metallopeptidase [Pseudomonadota bacterium]